MKQITILKKKDTDDVTSTQIRMVCQIKCRVLIEIKSNLPVSSGSILQLFSSVPLVVAFFKLEMPVDQSAPKAEICCSRCKRY